MIEIAPLSSERYPEWDAFVLRHPEGSVFHTTKWKTAIEKAFHHRSCYLCAIREGAICGLIPLFQLKSILFGNVLSSVPFAAYGGILAEDQETFSLLLKQTKLIAAGLKVDYVEFKFLQPKDTSLPESDTYFTFIQQIQPDSESNYNSIPRKQRRMIRVGIKSGLKPIFGNEYVVPFYEILAANFARLGTPVFGRNWFEILLETFEENIKLMVIEHEGKIISGVLTFYHSDTVLPYYAASIPEYRALAPNDFQYWELMKEAGERGYRFFDFGRSKKGTGSFDFKRHWGFEPTPLHYQFHLRRSQQLPELHPMNPKFKWKIELWKKLPLPFTKIIGPRIVKNIP
ncbi:MAG: FemAB family PEP-CTERM system-associated protein [Desulfobacteraceae bacterium]|nr:MAG: FemAB family PEP-CTERM system-associated protein [Desulfobacteraceae bacterium]